jgi:hypothetical protein
MTPLSDMVRWMTCDLFCRGCRQVGIAVGLAIHTVLFHVVD